MCEDMSEKREKKSFLTEPLNIFWLIEPVSGLAMLGLTAGQTEQ